MPNFFERASAGLSSLLNDATIRARAAKSTGAALGRAGGDLGERLIEALKTAARVRRDGALETSELCDLQVGVNCYADSPGFMRTQLWESLLDRAERERGDDGRARSGADAGRSEEGETLDDMCAILAADGYYETLQEAFEAKSEREREAENSGSTGDGRDGKEWRENVGASIERDLKRTFPHHEFFVASTAKGDAGRAALANILKAYAMHDSKVGYCQGMAFVAGLLLIYLPENRAFAAFVTLMEGSDFRSMYVHSMEGLKVRLRQLGAVVRAKNQTLAHHLEAHDITPVLYASGWFMSAFASDFPVRFSGRVMDCLLAQRSPSLIMRICLAILNEAAGDLLKLDDFEAIVVYLRTEPRAWSYERLNAVMESALSMHDLTDENVERMDKGAVATEDVVQCMPSPALAKGPSTEDPLIDASDVAESPRSPAHARSPSAVDDDKILDVIAMLDDWTTIEYDAENE